MQLFFLTTLFLFWLIFWSFSSVIIHRLKSWEGWILWGRSHCGSCNKTLQAIDLIPLFSWLLNWWKCRQCKAKVPAVYPLLELSSWILFACVWFFLIDFQLLASGNFWEILTLIFWLAISFVSIIYIFYDLLFLEIHEWVLASWVWIWAAWIIIQTFFWVEIFSSLNTININQEWFTEIALVWTWVLTATIIWLYTVILKELESKWDILILLSLYVIIYSSGFALPENINRGEVTWISASIWALAIFTFFYLQILVSGGKWMWWGDLRIAIMVWIILWTALSFPAMMLCYFAWSIIWVAFLAYQKSTKKGEWKLDSQIPFGPFIAIWFFLAIFFQDAISEYISNYLFI